MALTVACVALAAGYVALAARRASPGAEMDAGPPAPAITTLSDPAPQVLFRSTGLDADYGRLAVVPAATPRGARGFTQLTCERVDFAAGRGLCLAADRGVLTTYRGYGFGEDLRVDYDFRLSGIPSRTRLSADGRYAAVTVFVTGHSYAQDGFSTETTIHDARTGERLSQLEEFTVWRDGQRFESVDFNFWGVTFAPDSNRFYATLASRGVSYLVEGDVAAAQATVIAEDVECPSLSPDGRRLAFKRRVTGGPVRWRLHVLDLSTMSARPLAEERSVDDQIEWLDDDHILYGLPRDSGTSTAITDTWILAVDGTAAPSLFVPRAWSAVVVG